MLMFRAGCQDLHFECISAVLVDLGSVVFDG